ncbi:MAG: 3'(2'),5'-bisphosphate nucleotidase [Deltaproteobacteria bacterium]|nr:3'(2'),5'-bisphosphate nucleotidase [Deltaproteobacteria bacterium]
MARSVVSLAATISRAVSCGLDGLREVTKDDRSPVTIGDFAIQALVIQLLRDALGDVVVVAEEHAALLRQPDHRLHLEAGLALLEHVWPGVTAESMLASIDRGARDAFDAATGSAVGRSARREFWTLDPIDGTKGFLRHQQYCTALALISEGRPVLGVLGCPHLSEDLTRPVDQPDPVGTMFFAVEHEGAFVAPLGVGQELGRPLRRRAVDLSQPVRVCESYEKSHSAENVGERVVRASGLDRHPSIQLDSQCKYAVVARGQADAYLRVTGTPDYRERIWDHAAGSLIASEAGCTVSDIHGRPLRFLGGRDLVDNFGIVVAPSALHARLLKGCEAFVEPEPGVESSP